MTISRLRANLHRAQNALIDKAIVREKVIVKTIKDRAPIVETYIQNMKPDPVLGQVPESDQHFLSRVDFKSVINDDSFAVNKATSQGAELAARWDSLSIPSPLSRAWAAACTSPSTRPASSRCS